MSSIATRRILSDFNDLMQNSKSLQESGIFFNLDEDDLFHMRAMIIGPEGTPYEKGFYLFDIKFPKDYPNLPPVFEYMTNYRSVRFNPNLYTSGKVCISLLNTWTGAAKGEGWTPSNTITSVFMSIQGMVMNEHPLTNEPGYEHLTLQHEKYNELLRHENFYTAVLRMIKNTPKGFEFFQETMTNYFMKNLEWYLNKTLELQKKHKNAKFFSCSYQHNNVPQEYAKIYDNFIKLAKSLNKDMKLNLDIDKIDSQTREKYFVKDDKESNAKESNTKSTADSKKGACQGKTLTGKSCSKTAKDNGFCMLHVAQASK